jgi:hypothetical protein
MVSVCYQLVMKGNMIDTNLRISCIMIYALLTFHSKPGSNLRWRQAECLLNRVGPLSSFWKLMPSVQILWSSIAYQNTVDAYLLCFSFLACLRKITLVRSLWTWFKLCFKLFFTVKGLMVEALTMVQSSSLGTELQVILREDSGQFLPRLDEGKAMKATWICNYSNWAQQRGKL